MEIKDVKIGDKVQIRKDIPDEELIKLLCSHCLTVDDAFALQRRGEVTVEDIQEGTPDKEDDDWDSITLEEMNFYWPIELFEPVSKSNAIKSKEEQVQEDIQTVKDIIKRYDGLSEAEGPACRLITWLEDWYESGA